MLLGHPAALAFFYGSFFSLFCRLIAKVTWPILTKLCGVFVFTGLLDTML